jgi:hypothetical protein
LNSLTTQEAEMTQATIRIRQGSYRNRSVDGMTFELVTQFTKTAKNSFVTVRNGGNFPNMPETIRVNVSSPADYEFVSGAVIEPSAVENTVETDQQVMERIRERFEILTDMTKAAISGEIRAMIVSGPPGVGKSFGIEREIEKATLLDQLAGRRLRAEVVKGSATALGLYCTLYKYSDPNCILVFDDCDSILLDDVALNLLKGALDSGKKRKISWLSDSNMLRREGVPDTFNFNGSVIFITNLKFDQMKSQKLRDHLDALQSRCHYLDLTLDTMRDKILRIKQIAKDGELFEGYDFDPSVQEEIIAFMDTNKNKLREMSLRMALKIADLRKSFPKRWAAMASSTCMKPSV